MAGARYLHLYKGSALIQGSTDLGHVEPLEAELGQQHYSSQENPGMLSLAPTYPARTSRTRRYEHPRRLHAWAPISTWT